ncbi:hypothetical protein BKA83DRAFT_31409, partial [Pisolithus microcarpus]
AILSAIIHIDHNDFWLMADGGYLRPNKVCKDILDVKPSCTLLNPGLEPMISDFPLVLQTLQQCTQRCVTPSFSSGIRMGPGTSSFITNCSRYPIIMAPLIPLLQSLDSHSNNGDTWDATIQTTGISKRQSLSMHNAYSFEHWPLTKERNHAELLALKNTYCILPLPAYNITNDLIQPLAYQCSPQGAIAKIHFNLLHWDI